MLVKSISLIKNSAKLAQIAGSTRQVWHRLMTWLMDSQEIRIRSITTPLGQSLWDIYDPTTQQSIQRLSEEDVRIWLEERYDAQPEPDFRFQMWAVDARL